MLSPSTMYFFFLSPLSLPFTLTRTVVAYGSSIHLSISSNLITPIDNFLFHFFLGLLSSQRSRVPCRFHCNKENGEYGPKRRKKGIMQFYCGIFDIISSAFRERKVSRNFSTTSRIQIKIANMRNGLLSSLHAIWIFDEPKIYYLNVLTTQARHVAFYV